MRKELFKKLLSLFLVINIIFPHLYNGIVFAEDTQAVTLTILTDPGKVNHNGDYKKVYWTGEEIEAFADFSISGAGVDIKNPVAKITVPKVKVDGVVVIEKPTFVKSAVATSWEVTEDENNYYATYHFNSLKGGQFSTIPFPFRFLNKVTPGGVKVTPTFELFDGDGGLIKKASVTYTSKVTDWDSEKKVNDHRYLTDRIDSTTGEVVQLIRREQSVDKPALTRTPSEGWTVNYWLTFKALEGHTTYGKYVPQVVKIVDKLPVGAELSERSINEGWVYDKDTHTATWKGKLDLTTFIGENRLYKPISLIFKDYPVFHNQNSKKEVDHAFVIKNKADFYINADTDQEKKLAEREDNAIFESYETIRPPFGKTENFIFDALGAYTNERYDNVYDSINNDLTENDGKNKSVHFYSRVAQSNNGSSYEEPNKGGLTREIKRITWEIDDRLYTKFVKPNLASNYSREKDYQPNKEILRQRFNDASKKLYGVKPDGSRELITTDLTIDTKFVVDDTTKKYSSIQLEFDEPLVLENSSLGMQIEGYPISSELAKFTSGEYKSNQKYYIWMNVDSKREDENEYTHYPKEREKYNYNNFTQIRLPEPKIRFYGIDGNYTVPYGDNNVRIERVGTHLFGTWTGLDSHVKVKQITLLPSGIEFKNHDYISWGDPAYRKVTPIIIPNFKDTGKTAVIYEYELNFDGNDHNYYRANFNVDTTIYANAGPNILEHYFIWDRNDIIEPTTGVTTDTLDFDGDGNFDERIMKTTTIINFIPPLEVVSKKTVALTTTPGGLTAPAQDIGEGIYYRVNVLNNSIKNLSTLSIIDVLPYVGDHKIVANEDGNYLPRNSEFETPLISSVEAIPENAEVLKKFDVLYSLVPQGDNLESVRDTNWVRAENIQDFSKVKSIKFTLKQGQTLQPQEEASILIHSKIPYDENLPISSVSKNSFAISGDNVNYVEANEVTATNVKYTVNGTVFFDKNKTGENAGKINDDDVKLAGYEAKLMNADGTEYLDANGKPVIAITDSNGNYSMNVYKRGEYYVQFKKKERDEKFTKVHGEVGTVGNDAEQDSNDLTQFFGKTPKFTLNPLKLSATRNAGILVTRGEIKIKKTDENGKLLQGVKFEIKDKNSTFKKELVTDDKGEIVFKDLIFSTYQITETETLIGYDKIKEVEEVTLSEDNAIVEVAKVNNLIKGKVVVTKADADNTKIKLPNVEFVLKQGDVEKYTATTNAEGIATFENVLFGEYTLEEKTALANYNKSTRTENVNIDSQGKVVNLEYTNQIKKGKVVVTKKDAETNAKLANVEFVLIQGDVEKYTATTNAEGVATFENVVYGEYTLEEKIALVNYNKSERTENVNIDAQDKVVNFEYTNQIKKGKVVVTKKDAETNAKLANVEFVLKQGDVEKYTATTNAEGIATFENVIYGEYTLEEKTALVNYNKSERIENVNIDAQDKVVNFEYTNQIKKGKVTFVKVDAEDETKTLSGVVFELRQNGEVKYTATSQIDGKVEFDGVIYGEYELVEKSTLANYNKLEKSTVVNIDSEGKVVDLGNVTNQIKKGLVSVIKVDAENAEKKLSGVKFVLKQNEEVKYEAVTNEEGKALFTGVVYGDYVLEEKETLENYNLSTETREVQVREDGVEVTLGTVENQIKKGSVTVTKVDADNILTKLPNVVFVLKQNDEVKYEATTNADGVATFENVVYGQYTLEEKTPLANYNKSTRTENVNIDSDGKVVALGNFTNQIKKGKVVVTKKDVETNAKLADVVFVLKQNDEVKYEATTNADGIATFENVIYGEYTLEEKTALVNYNKSERTENVNIDSQDKVVNFEYTNQIKKGKVTFVKIDAEDETKTLDGVVFELRQNGEVKYTATSKDSGKVEFDGVIYGEYDLVEKTSLDNYNLDEQVRKVNIDSEGKVVDLGNVTNQIKKGSVSVIKVDAENAEKKLSGVKFVLKQNEEVKYEAVTNEEGKALFTGVVYGDYVLEEKETLENYNLSTETREVQVRENNKEVELGNFTNQIKKSSVSVVKVDAENAEKKLAGVKFVLKQNAEVKYEAVTNEEGKALFTGVVYGDYVLEEKETLENYNLSTETREVQVRENNKEVELGNFTNQIKKGSIVLTKVDADNSDKKLEGVVFELKLGEQVIQEVKTDKDGIARFDNVVYGKYTVVEKETLNGYELITTPIDVEIKDNGKIVDLGMVKNKMIPNEKIKEVPKTGISSQSQLTLFMISILGLAFSLKLKKED